MKQSPSKRHMQLLTVGLIACIGLVGVALWGIWILSSKIDRLETNVNMAARDAAVASAATEATSWRTDDLITRVELLEQTTGAPSLSLKMPTAQQLEELAPGLYELDTSSQYDPDNEEASPYTIAHVVVEMRYGDYGSKLHVGIATSGWMVPKGVYFDYDNDGQIDTDMAMNFIRDIPVLGGRLAKAYDPVESQNLYSVLVSQIDSAEHTSVSDMVEDAEAASSYAWTFVQDQYETIEEWISQALSDQPKAE